MVPYLFLRGRKDPGLLSAEMEHTDHHMVMLSSELRQDLTIVSEEVGDYRRQRAVLSSQLKERRVLGAEYTPTFMRRAGQSYRPVLHCHEWRLLLNFPIWSHSPQEVTNDTSLWHACLQTQSWLKISFKFLRLLAAGRLLLSWFRFLCSSKIRYVKCVHKVAVRSAVLLCMSDDPLANISQMTSSTCFFFKY